MRSRFLILGASWALISAKAWAGPSTLPGAGFDASRYEVLWTKSPFSVSSAEAAPESPDYALVGVARFDGIYYASLIDQKNQEHFLVSTVKPARGLTLISVTPGQGNTDTFAMVQRNGETLTLKMVAAAANAAANAPPGNIAPATPAVIQPPIVRRRFPINHLPPRPP